MMTNSKKGLKTGLRALALLATVGASAVMAAGSTPARSTDQGVSMGQVILMNKDTSHGSGSGSGDNGRGGRGDGGRGGRDGSVSGDTISGGDTVSGGDTIGNGNVTGDVFNGDGNVTGDNIVGDNLL